MNKYFLVAVLSIIAASSFAKVDIPTLLMNKNIKKLDKAFSDRLKKAVSGKEAVDYINDLEATYGKVRSIEFNRDIKENKSYTVNMVSGKTSLLLGFDNNNLLDTLWFGNSLVYNNSEIKVKSFDGLELSTLIEIPKDNFENVVIMVHGSGPNDYNEIGFGERTVQSNGLFYRLSKELTKNSFATIRYNKRTSETGFLSSIGVEVEKYNNKNKYYDAFIKDIDSMIAFAKSKFPGKKIYLLGHSQGTGLVLQSAHKRDDIEGVILTGFSTTPILVSAFEQSIYRSHYYFKSLDKNHDEVIAENELDKNLKKQMEVLDLNKDKKLSLMEYNGGNMINLNNMLMNNSLSDLSMEELSLPGIPQILKKSQFKVLFVQGEWDHQTPVSYTYGIQHMNNLYWKKTNMQFLYLPKVGHGLNTQKKFIEYNYAPAEHETIKKVVEYIAKNADS